MDTENLLAGLAVAFDTSDHNKSQHLLKRIIDMASQKLNTQNISKTHSVSKTQNSIKFLKRMFEQDNKKPKRKFISKGRLRRIVIKKISSKNKKVHEQFIKATQQKQFKIDKRTTLISNLSIRSLDKQEHKFQQNDQDYEDYYLQQKNGKAPEEMKGEKRGKRRESYKQKIRQKFKKTRKNFQNYLNSISKESKADEVTCPICIQILIDPVSTICGHSFCFKCIDESLLFGSNCPVCRLHIKNSELLPCKYLKEFIKSKFVEQLEDQSAIQTYELRKNQNQDWKNTRFVDPRKLKEGNLIDVRDTQNIWCKATILKIYCAGKKISSILVHYQQWAKIYDEVIEIKSIRLAPLEFFSSRTDIPRYNLGNEEEHLRGAVIIGNNNEGIIRNPGSELAFSSIEQLNNLRNRFNSLQNNIFGEMIPLPFIGNRQVGFLHQVISQDRNENQWRRNPVQVVDFNSEEENDSVSSLGSFVYGRQAIPIDSQDEAEHSEIGEPAGNQFQQFISIYDSVEEGDEDDMDDEYVYWNARPESAGSGEQNSDGIGSFSPLFMQVIPHHENHIDVDELSYEENSYSQ